MMPDGWPIRNKFIEDQHKTVIASEVVTRKMTPEEWEKYGPKNEAKGVFKLPRRKSMRKRIDFEKFLPLAQQYGLTTEGREKIAEELDVTRADVSYYVCRADIKKKLKAAGLLPEKATEENKKEQLIKDIAKELNVHMEQPSKSSGKPLVEMHLNLCGDLHETYKVKNMSYGNSFSATFQEFGIISALTRMSDKWNRIKALATGTRNDVKDESLEDTLMDLANYCLMTVMELRKR